MTGGKCVRPLTSVFISTRAMRAIINLRWIQTDKGLTKFRSFVAPYL
jgi:hypothetical protein